MKAILDCNSFYCSCERLFRPDLRQRPVVVLSNNDGCIISRTDEAKQVGIAMAAPYFQYRDLMEQNGVAVFSSNYSLYGDLSRRVMDTLRGIVGNKKVEVYSVDEAFLDLDRMDAAELLASARSIRDQVEQWTGIQVSIGVAPTKVLCKVANRLAKKNKEKTGCILVLDTEEKIRSALQATPVEDIWGVGRRYARKLVETWGITDGWQLRNMNPEWARRQLGGIVGVRLIRELNGEPCLEMKDPLEKKQHIATTRMFGKPVYELGPIREAVATYTARAAEKLRRQASAAAYLEVFLVSKEYGGPGPHQSQTHTAAATLPLPSSVTSRLMEQALPLVDRLFEKGGKYIKAGVLLGGLVPDAAVQGSMFSAPGSEREKKLMTALDNINFSMRDDILKYAASGLERNWKMRQEKRSARYTTRWEELFEVH